jgi:hypothetical protein
VNPGRAKPSGPPLDPDNGRKWTRTPNDEDDNPTGRAHETLCETIQRRSARILGKVTFIYPRQQRTVTKVFLTRESNLLFFSGAQGDDARR